MQKTFPGLTLASEELIKALEHLETWLTSQVEAAQIISKALLKLFEDTSKEKSFLNLPATLIGETSGWVYGQISDKFPKDITLLDCIILTGINLAQNPQIKRQPGWEQVIVKMIDIKNIIKPGTNLSKECENIQKVTEGVISIKPFNTSNKTGVFVFSVRFDFEKNIPELMLS